MDVLGNHQYPLCEDAYRRLSNALRRYAEASGNFPRLSQEDREEAINNLDHALDAVLQGIHSTCDAMQAENIRLGTYSAGDIAACTIVRNARHHNAGLFRCWNQLVLEGFVRENHGATMLMVEHSCVEEPVFPPSKYFIRLEDFQARIDAEQNHIPNAVDCIGLLNQDCGFECIRVEAAEHRFPARQIYISLIPFVCNTVTRITKHLTEQGCAFTGYDANVYATHFNEYHFNLQQPEFNHLPIIDRDAI